MYQHGIFSNITYIYNNFFILKKKDKDDIKYI